jgi:DNA mismatch repair ATPase MutS
VKAHLLFPDRDLPDVLPANHEDLVRDLELGTVIRAMSGGDKFVADVSTRVLLNNLTDPVEIRYRQAILEDFLSHPDLLQKLCGVVIDALNERRSVWGFGRLGSPSLVLSGARRHLEMFLDHLRKLRALADEWRASVRSLGLIELFDSIQTDLSDEYLKSAEQHVKRLAFRDGLLLSAQLGRDNTGQNYTLRTPNRQSPGWKERLGLAPRTVYSFSIHPRDDAGLQALEELRNRGLNRVANSVAQSADHINNYFTLLRLELAFYLGCLNLHEILEQKGQPIAIPDVVPAEDAALGFTDLRDPCLALQANAEIIGNDVDGDGRSLIIVTGANSGGKSTFLRSVGVAQLMAQAGMFVTARTYRSSPCSAVFTHFLRKEDASMRAGRLEEELARISGFIPYIRPNALFLFNESFHSTNEREGSEIARQIVRALRESHGRVVAVSHQYDFASSFLNEGGGAVMFLKAFRRPDGRRDYHLIPDPPEPTAYGDDLYSAVFGETGE